MQQGYAQHAMMRWNASTGRQRQGSVGVGYLTGSSLVNLAAGVVTPRCQMTASAPAQTCSASLGGCFGPLEAAPLLQLTQPSEQVTSGVSVVALFMPRFSDARQPMDRSAGM